MSRKHVGGGRVMSGDAGGERGRRFRAPVALSNGFGPTIPAASPLADASIGWDTCCGSLGATLMEAICIIDQLPARPAAKNSVVHSSRRVGVTILCRIAYRPLVHVYGGRNRGKAVVR